MTLRQYICNGGRRIPRGATSRVAAFLGTGWHRARALIAGLAAPEPHEARLMQDFIHSGADFSAKKTGPANKSACVVRG